VADAGRRRRYRCMGFCPRVVCRGSSGGRGFWCMGFCQRFRLPPSCRLGRRDCELPWCEGLRLGPQQRAIVCPAQSVGPVGRWHQDRRHAIQPGGQLGRQPVAATHRLEQHLTAVEHGEHVAIVGTGFGVIAAVDGARLAQAGEALRGARSGASPAMHAAAPLSPDRRRTARTAGAGEGATAWRECEVGVAPALFRPGWCGNRIRPVLPRNELAWRCTGGHGRADPDGCS
jgi:hypothetical protein